MGKLFKVIGGLLAVVILLVVAAAIILPMVIDPNDYKGEIISQVKQQTGRDLKIAGDLKLSVFPWLGVETGGLELSNAKGFGDQPFAAINRTAVRVKLMPLLSRQLEVDTVELEGVTLNLAKSKSGASNWDDLAKGGTPAQKDQPKPSGETGLAGFVIGGVDIRNARIRWDDQSRGQHFAVDQFFLKSGAIRPGKPVALELGATLQSKAPKLTAELKLEGMVSLDAAAGLASIQDLKLQLDATGPQLPEKTLTVGLSADLGMALNGQSLTVDRLTVTSDTLRLTGNLKGSDLTTQPTFSGELNLAELNLREWLTGQGIALPETADPQVLTQFAANLELATKGNATQLNRLSIGLDDTKINGTASLKGDAIGFALDVDSINLDRYLPPQKEEASAKAPAPTGAKTTGDEPLMPIELLRSLNLNGSLKIGQLIINNLTARQIELIVKARQGKIQLDQKIGAFYQGSLNGTLGLNVAGKTPLMQVENQVKDIQAGPLLKDLIAKDKFDGKGNLQTKLQTSGNTINAIKHGLNGNLSFRFENGSVKGFNLAQILREGKARLKGEMLPTDSSPPQTDFSELSGSAMIQQGVLNNQDLLAKSPFLRVTGAGQVNLVTETLDYLVKTVIVSTAAGQGGEGLDELKGVPVPVKLTGPFTSPKYSIDWAQVVTGTQKAKIEEKKEELKQKLENKLKDKLKGFFN